MADQTGTPGSNADNSINGSSKYGTASKDKSCPFCHQQFTSSSLGRHLDLYIKDKNPKPADGIHLVDEIRKLRGGITRRQPRNSMRRRETSTPGGTPAAQDRKSPRPESENGDRSPSVREDIGTSNLLYAGRPRIFMQPPSWEATGVMNNIPPPKNSDTRSVDGEGKDEQRIEGKTRSVSKQMLAKSTLDQKQKMTEALDNARAAELALRELLGSLKAANRIKLSGPDIFDYDPLTLDFPALCLHCLPSPPTLHASTQVHNPSTWNISPPSDAQYEAIRAYFSTAFRNHRNTLAITSTAPVDDLSYPPPPERFLGAEEDPSAQIIRAESEANELELKINTHIHDVFAVWTSLSNSKRSEIWTLELARNAGRKSLEIQKLRKEKDYSEQTNAHLRQQIEDLSRIQLPREFRMAVPQTIPIDKKALDALGSHIECNSRSVGFSLLDRGEHLDTVVERAVERWKGVVREARGVSQSGMQGQRSLSGESLITSPSAMGNSGISGEEQNQQRNARLGMAGHHAGTIVGQKATLNMNHNLALAVSNGLRSLSSDQDADADADADMEEEDSYAEMGDLNDITGHNGQAGFRLSNGIGKGGGDGMEGIISGSGGRGTGFRRIGS